MKTSNPNHPTEPPIFFGGGVVPFQPAYDHHDLYDLNGDFPTSSMVGYVFLPREGNIERLSHVSQAKAGGLGVDLGRFLGFSNPWQALLATMACPRNLGKKDQLRLQICPQTDVR